MTFVANRLWGSSEENVDGSKLHYGPCIYLVKKGGFERVLMEQTKVADESHPGRKSSWLNELPVVIGVRELKSPLQMPISDGPQSSPSKISSTRWISVFMC